MTMHNINNLRVLLHSLAPSRSAFLTTLASLRTHSLASRNFGCSCVLQLLTRFPLSSASCRLHPGTAMSNNDCPTSVIPVREIRLILKFDAFQHYVDDFGYYSTRGTYIFRAYHYFL